MQSDIQNGRPDRATITLALVVIGCAALVALSALAFRALGEFWTSKFGDGTGYLTVINRTDGDIAVEVALVGEWPMFVGEPAPFTFCEPEDTIHPNEMRTGVDVFFYGRYPQDIEYRINAVDLETRTIIYSRETTFGEMEDAGWIVLITSD